MRVFFHPVIVIDKHLRFIRALTQNHFTLLLESNFGEEFLIMSVLCRMCVCKSGFFIQFFRELRAVAGAVSKNTLQVHLSCTDMPLKRTTTIWNPQQPTTTSNNLNSSTDINLSLITVFELYL